MLALIAGEGALPGLLAAKLSDAGQAPLIAALEGHQPADLTPDLIFRVETLGTFLLQLGQRGVTELCFAGAVARPALDPSKIDAATIPLVPVIMQAMQQGDDGALRAVLGIFEEKGFVIRAAHEVLPDLLPPSGILTREKPGDQAEKDAKRGAEIVTALGAADIGQSCVVHKGQALAVEAQPGTDWMLNSLNSRAPRTPCGILYKAPKPGQDRRIDLPTIGTTTVELVAELALDGIVIEAGGVMVPDQDQVIKSCDDAGLFLWVRDPGPGHGQ